MTAWDTTGADLAAMNRWHREFRILAGEVHDLGLDDFPEALLKLDGIIGVAMDWRALLTRRQEQQVRRVDERDETPGPDLSFASSFNGGE